MKSTLADNKQLFNVKAIATAGLTAGEIPNDTLGVIDVSTGLTVVPASWGDMPDEFAIISKVGGKVYYSFDNIEKDRIKNKVAVPYSAAQPNIWKTTIKSCLCMDDVLLNVNINDGELVQQDGLTWTHRDSVYEVSSEEMKCHCSCNGEHKVFENNIMTMLLHQKMQADQSQFYKSYVGVSIDGVATGGTLPGTGDEGELFIKTGADEGLYRHNGTAFVLIGDSDGIITDVEAFVEANKEVNTDDDDTNDGPMLELYLETIIPPTPNYADLEVNYVYRRGTTIMPSILIDSKIAVAFEEVQQAEFEIGAGYDVRAEEWENMNYYTDLNHYVQLSCGTQAPGVVYQFENGKNYQSVNFEFDTKKTLRNDGDTRLFGVLLATDDAGVYTSLKDMFGL